MSKKNSQDQRPVDRGGRKTKSVTMEEVGLGKRWLLDLERC